MYNLMRQGGLQGGYTQTGDLQNMGSYVCDPWTAALLVVMFAYFVTYYIILLRKHKHLPEASK
ncbi:MAG: hypothetical protein M1130_11020 [Actinobacteria bacterium]|nr:hypothetical protein [Actinomycetota bacterium]